jgi:exopolysaccharide biosynthesis WecB/TagA/CpsF family protein
MRDKLKFSKEDPRKKVKIKETKKFNFLNLYSLYLFKKSPLFKESVSYRHAVNFPDGKPVAKKTKLKQQRGPDFTKDFLMSAHAKNSKHFFVGLSSKDKARLSKITKIPQKNIRSYNPPFIKEEQFSKKEREKIINKVNKEKVNYLWVCIGNPKQEILSYQIFEKIKVDKIFNVGAATDFLLKKQKDAPNFFIKIGAESAYIGIMNPRRALKKIFGSFYALRYLGRVSVDRGD